MDALEGAGCVKVFVDVASGKRLAGRPQLAEALKYLRDGEDTLVVTKLDRLGRSVKNLKSVADQLSQRLHHFDRHLHVTRKDDPER